MGNFTNTLVILILFLCYDTYHPINHIKTTTYHVDRLDSVCPPLLLHCHLPMCS